MKVVVVSQFGASEVLRIEQRQDPVPDAGEALISVEAIGVGYVDVMARRGRYVAFPEPGFVPGLEVAGRVLAVGELVDQAWVGRLVFAMPMKGGGYSSLLAIPVEQLIAIPEGLSASQAVGLGMNALVAKIALNRVPIQSGEHIFVRGAGGGIGMMAVQIGAARGGIVTATTSSGSRGSRLRDLGAKTIVPRDHLPDDYDVAVDTIGGEHLGTYVKRLKSNGHYILCGGIGGAPKADFGMEVLGIFHRSPTFMAFSLNSVETPAVVAAGVELFDDAVQGKIQPTIDREMPMSSAAEAHDLVENGAAFGKIVLKPD